MNLVLASASFFMVPLSVCGNATVAALRLVLEGEHGLWDGIGGARAYGKPSLLALSARLLLVGESGLFFEPLKNMAVGRLSQKSADDCPELVRNVLAQPCHLSEMPGKTILCCLLV